MGWPLAVLREEKGKPPHMDEKMEGILYKKVVAGDLAPKLAP